MATKLEMASIDGRPFGESQHCEGWSNVDSNCISIQQSRNLLSSASKQLCCPYEKCTKSFNRQARLTEHLRSHSNERPFRCPGDDCSKSFLRDSHLKHHIKSAHTDERNYSCPREDCQRSFATGTRLRRHEASHEMKEKYTCRGYGWCSERFRKHATLSRHILAVHENKKPFPCPELDNETQQQCTLGFDTAEKLRSHHRALHDPSRFVCSACGPAPPGELGGVSQASFTTYAALQRHIADCHPPKCSYCSLVCTSERNLRRHLELFHDLVDPQAAYNAKSSNFPCTHLNCDRAFSKKGNLNVHVKTVHEGHKDFVCGQTELKFIRPDCHLSDRKESETAEDDGGDDDDDNDEDERVKGTVTVTGCGRYFTSKATLQEHVRTVHLGQDSKRQQRNKRKRAEGEATASVDGVPLHKKTKRRNPRTSTTVRSAIAALTGSIDATIGAKLEAPAPHQISNDNNKTNNNNNNPFDQPLYQPDFNFSHPYSDCDPTLSFLQNQQQQQQEEEVAEYNTLFFSTAAELEEQQQQQQGSFSTESNLNWNSLPASVLVDPMLMSSWNKVANGKKKMKKKKG